MTNIAVQRGGGEEVRDGEDIWIINVEHAKKGFVIPL